MMGGFTEDSISNRIMKIKTTCPGMPISLFTGKNSENHFSWGHFIKKENKYSVQLANICNKKIDVIKLKSKPEI